MDKERKTLIFYVSSGLLILCLIAFAFMQHQDIKQLKTQLSEQDTKLREVEYKLDSKINEDITKLDELETHLTKHELKIAELNTKLNNYFKKRKAINKAKTKGNK